MLKRIYILFTAILALAIIATGLAAIQVVNTLADHNNRSYLLSAARLVSLELSDDIPVEKASQRAMEIFGAYESSLRVTLVDRSGKVLYDSQASQGEMENHLFRPEISSAFQTGETGSAIRLSSTVNERMLYMAVYDAKRDIVIRTAMSLSAGQAAMSGIITTILTVMAIALITLLIAGIFLTRIITRPLINLQKAAQAMAEGDYNVRVHNLRQGDGEVRVLSQTFNTMAANLQKVVQDLADKNARLDIIFDSMTDPLMTVKADLT
ncbi:MAG TPA: hypothetical protein DCM45_03090, partial [Clostridiales bacterium]|nr:hypothetical protein [Clostridiales bacterium]